MNVNYIEPPRNTFYTYLNVAKAGWIIPEIFKYLHEQFTMK